MLRKAIAFARALFARKPAALDWAPTYDPNDSVELAPAVKLDGGGTLRSDDGKTLIVNATDKPLFVAFEPAPRLVPFGGVAPRALERLKSQLTRSERERVMDAFYDRDPSREARTLADVFINRAKGE